jgi:hypothetical protein
MTWAAQANARLPEVETVGGRSAWTESSAEIKIMRMLLWLALLLGGNLLLVAGLFLTRLTWRPEVEPFGRGSPILQIMIHPERFVMQERLREIRLLNLFGGVLLCGAVGVLAYDIISVMLRG